VLSRQIGLRGVAASHGPRLHDMRHYSGSRIIPATDGQGVRLLAERALAYASMAE